MRPFVYEAPPYRVVFGWNALDQLFGELDRLGVRRALVLSTPTRQEDAESIAGRIGERIGVLAGAVMHTPGEVTERVLVAVRECTAYAILAVGGGSTTGLGKAVALRTDLPQIVVPTTYAGSEMTPILGQTTAGVKTTQRATRILPEVVVYDPALTLSLRPTVSAASGLNIIAHAAEALNAWDGNPIIALMAEDGIRALMSALPTIARDPGNREARVGALHGAWRCGVALGTVGMALHHKLSHVLEGGFDLPHAEPHAVVLPHVVAFNATAAPDAVAAVARALGGGSAADALRRLGETIGAPTVLRDIGMPTAGIDRAADLAVANPYWNPRAVDRPAIRALIEDTWHERVPDATASRLGGAASRGQANTPAPGRGNPCTPHPPTARLRRSAISPRRRPRRSPSLVWRHARTSD